MTTWSDALSGSDAVEAWEVHELLSLLVEKSLVVPDGPGRWRMLETVRDYGRNLLADRAESDDNRDRHLHCFLALAEEAEPRLTAADQQLWLERLEAEHDNVRAGLQWSCADGDNDERLLLGLRMAGALRQFWSIRGYLVEGRGWLEQARLLDVTAAPGVRAKALNGAGVLAVRQGDFPAARSFLQESLAIARDLADRQSVASSLNNLGNAVLGEGDLAAARRLFEGSTMRNWCQSPTQQAQVLMPYSLS